MDGKSRVHVLHDKITSLAKVIWEEGRVAVLSLTYAVVPIGIYNGESQIRPQNYPFL